MAVVDTTLLVFTQDQKDRLMKATSDIQLILGDATILGNTKPVVAQHRFAARKRPGRPKGSKNIGNNTQPAE